MSDSLLSVSQFFNKPFQYRKLPGNAIDLTHPQETRPVRLTALVPTQLGVDDRRVQEMLDKPEKHSAPIMVYKVGGQMTIFDGHHRAVAAMRRGDKTIPARIWTSKQFR